MQFFTRMKTDLERVIMIIVNLCWKSFKLQIVYIDSFVSIQSYESFFWFRTNLWVAVGIFEHSGCGCNFSDLSVVVRSLRRSSLEWKALQRSDLLSAFSSKSPRCEVWLSLEGDKILLLSDFLQSIPTKESIRCSVWKGEEREKMSFLSNLEILSERNKKESKLSFLVCV